MWKKKRTTLNSCHRLNELKALLGREKFTIVVNLWFSSYDEDFADELDERIGKVPKQIAQEFGIVIRPIAIRVSNELTKGAYKLIVNGVVVGEGKLLQDYLMALAPDERVEPIDGVPTEEPPYGVKAWFIKQSDREKACSKGYTVVNCPTVVTAHATKILENYLSDIIGYPEVMNMVDLLKNEIPALAREVLESHGTSLIYRLIKALLEEQVPVYNMDIIFERLLDIPAKEDFDTILAKIRVSLGTSIVERYRDTDGALNIYEIPKIDHCLKSDLNRINAGITNGFHEFKDLEIKPIFICESSIRRALFLSLKNTTRGAAAFLAKEEMPPDQRVIKVNQKYGIVLKFDANQNSSSSSPSNASLPEL